MKHKGSSSDFIPMRNADLMRAYRYWGSLRQRLSIDQLGALIVDMPSARFWVSDERAAVVVSQMLAGRPVLKHMRLPKREMFQEIYRRTLRLMKATPGARLIEIISVVIHTPAPKFYMMPRTATETIYKIRNGFYDKNNTGNRKAD